MKSHSDPNRDNEIAELHRIQQQLRESEERHRGIVDSAMDAIVTIDHQNLITEFNPAAEEIFGWKKAQAIGRDLAELIIPPGLREGHRLGLQRHLQDPRHAPRLRARLELPALHADGSEFPIELTVTRLRGGGAPQFTAFIRDLTQKHQAQAEARRLAEQLQASESQYRSLFVDNPQAMCVYDPETLRFLAVNTAGIAQYGYTEAEFLGGMTIEQLRPAEDVQAWRREVFSRPLLGRRQHHGRHRRKNGELLQVETFANDIVFQGKRARVVLAYDVTEQRRAAQELRDSEARFRALSELSADWFWEQDAQFRFIHVSTSESWPPGLPPASSILGKTRWEMDDLEMDDWRAHREQLQRHEPFRDVEVRRRAANGQVRHVTISGSPIFDEEGRFTGYRGVGRDVTAGKQAQEEIARLNAELEERVRERTAQLEVANRELEAFSYSIAHDLRSPLTSIDGFSHMLGECCGDQLNDKGHHYLGRIRTGVRQMADLTEAMLSLAHLSRVNLRSEAVDLAAVARRIVTQLREQAPQREAVVEIPEHLWALGDPRLLTQVMTNLLGNAWKFSTHKPVTHITVDSRELEGELVYCVADQGAGFDMAHSARLFGAFQRLHAPSEFEGTGIGLALVQKIVSRHGGRIWAEAGLDQGARFYFTLAAEPSP